MLPLGCSVAGTCIRKGPALAEGVKVATIAVRRHFHDLSKLTVEMRERFVTAFESDFGYGAVGFR